LDSIQYKPIYDQLSPFSYLHKRDWRLRFLRCELFQCQKAAERLVRFTVYMENEYDMEVLERPLRLSDLQTKSGKRGNKEMDSFRSGHSQLFPFRDRSGRRIIVTRANHPMKYEADIRVRRGHPWHFDIGVKSAWWYQYKAHTLSIPVFPYTDSNNIKTKNYHVWIRGRKAIEGLEEHKRKNNDASPIHLIECPTLADVVFKTGTSNVYHPGNAAFRDLLYAYQDEYFKALSGAEKQDTVSKIIQDVENREGRFLEWNNCGCWIVLQDVGIIRSKIYNSLFYFNKTLESKKNIQASSSSTFLFERQDGKERKRDQDGREPHGCAKACSFW
jgi:hypothetical protein